MTTHKEVLKGSKTTEEMVTDKIFTLANVISFIRLIMVGVFLVLLLNGYNVASAVVFGIAAATDFVDGQIARRTHTVSKLGQLLDPAVDRILMITGVLGVFLVGRVPLWIILLVLIRDLILLVGGGWLLKRYHIRVAVVYVGKFATTFLFLGFAFLLLGWPQVPGLGITDISWLPGFTAQPAYLGIWFVYIGLVLAMGTTVYYCMVAYRKLKREREKEAKR